MVLILNGRSSININNGLPTAIGYPGTGEKSKNIYVEKSGETVFDCRQNIRDITSPFEMNQITHVLANAENTKRRLQ